uniref:Ribosomal protein L19 n=1 Tax=Pseudochlorodesmis sp. HV01306a TaxID=2358488 RepID=A0A386AY14_9CHLO|nr:ribosomal protein L19 [Pseudochlorodesmis sp. HV01306a]
MKHFDNKTPMKIQNNIVVGDYIKVGFLFKEGEKKRIQFVEGIIIAITGPNFEKKITLRKPGIYGFELIFSCKSPKIQSLKILQSQKFSRSKLFFLRQRIGKAAFGLKNPKKLS